MRRAAALLAVVLASATARAQETASPPPAPVPGGPEAAVEDGATSVPPPPRQGEAAGSDAAKADADTWSATGEPMSPPWGTVRPTPPAPAHGFAGKMGARGIGLGIEPLVSVTTGPGHGQASYGFGLGTALSLEVIPPLLVRAYYSYDQGYGAKPGISWGTQSGWRRSRQDAGMWGLELGGGLAWLFRSDDSPLVPFVGLDGAAAFAGWRFDFASDDPRVVRTSVPPIIRTRDTDPHEAIAWSWLATAHLGVRYSMLSWLASQVDLGVSYWASPRHAIGNTLTSLSVSSTGEAVWLVRLTYSVRLGI